MDKIEIGTYLCLFLGAICFLGFGWFLLSYLTLPSIVSDMNVEGSSAEAGFDSLVQFNSTVMPICSGTMAILSGCFFVVAYYLWKKQKKKG